MPKEIINTDPALSKEFYDMLDEQREKLSKEEMARRALWGLEVLIQEGLINPESTVAEIITVIEKRRMELKGSMDYAEELKHSGISDEVDASLHKVAVEESEKSKEDTKLLIWETSQQLMSEFDFISYGEKERCTIFIYEFSMIVKLLIYLVQA